MAHSRAHVVHAIDVWMESHVPQHRYGSTLHTETFGSVVDRIAAACVSADHLMVDIGPSDLAAHTAWLRLAELADGYTDLIAEVTTGRRRLPVPAALE
ncbi:DUF4254 domain-containing protein [Nocardia sp. NPDC050793]|uniref:DUF4254 domain-containing protein n=1 Tax=Nocardia sp. NPDC050793 TaxID=3155159 RepID=UPI00340D81BF